jgi:hypothetical protein
MSDFSIGDRVFSVDEDDETSTGTIEALLLDEDDEEAAQVRWDNDEVEEVSVSLLDHLDPDEDPAKLEKEFKELCELHMKEIDEQLTIAADAIAKAEEIAEEHGIPFSSGVSPLSQSYFPATFADKFSKLEQDFVSDITGAYSEYYNDGAGWEHSAVC